MEFGQSTTVDLAGSLSVVQAVLSDPESLRCFEQELDLPIVGRRTQTVVMTAGIEFCCAGDLWSVSGSWRLAADDGGQVRGELEVSCRVAESLAREAVDAYRSRSPLPIRTDADAILRRVVEDLFREKLTADIEAYRRRVEWLLFTSLRPRPGGRSEGALIDRRDRA